MKSSNVIFNSELILAVSPILRPIGKSRELFSRPKADGCKIKEITLKAAMKKITLLIFLDIFVHCTILICDYNH